MPKKVVDKSFRKALNEARELIDAAIKADANEAETRRRIEDMFISLMGYDKYKHITAEHAIHGIGDTEHCDIAICVNEDNKIPSMLIEIKRASMDIASKHLKQVASYGINIGCEWILLTNGSKWQLYHISFGQPPRTILLDSRDLLSDEPAELADKFALVGYRNVKRDGLKELWEKNNVLTLQNVLKMLLSEESISMVRRGLKKSTEVTVTPEEIVGAIRRLLNEAALEEMAKVKICLPMKKQRRITAQPVTEESKEPVPTCSES